MAIASQRVLLATNARYGTYGTYRVAGLNEFDLAVTDDTLSETAAQRMREAGLALEIAPAVSDAAVELH